MSRPWDPFVLPKNHLSVRLRRPAAARGRHRARTFLTNAARDGNSPRAAQWSFAALPGCALNALSDRIATLGIKAQRGLRFGKWRGGGVQRTAGLPGWPRSSSWVSAQAGSWACSRAHPRLPARRTAPGTRPARSPRASCRPSQLSSRASRRCCRSSRTPGRPRRSCNLAAEEGCAPPFPRRASTSRRSPVALSRSPRRARPALRGSEGAGLRHGALPKELVLHRLPGGGLVRQTSSGAPHPVPLREGRRRAARTRGRRRGEARRAEKAPSWRPRLLHPAREPARAEARGRRRPSSESRRLPLPATGPRGRSRLDAPENDRASLILTQRCMRPGPQ